MATGCKTLNSVVLPPTPWLLRIRISSVAFAGGDTDADHVGWSAELAKRCSDHRGDIEIDSRCDVC